LRAREREKERKRERVEKVDRVGGERSAHKETLLEILWCDDYLDSLHEWNNVKTPPRNESFTQRESVVERGATAPV
jgi:hypothetical protein